jgi:hypothetical protein
MINERLGSFEIESDADGDEDFREGFKGSI